MKEQNTFMVGVTATGGMVLKSVRKVENHCSKIEPAFDSQHSVGGDRIRSARSASMQILSQPESHETTSQMKEYFLVEFGFCEWTCEVKMFIRAVSRKICLFCLVF